MSFSQNHQYLSDTILGLMDDQKFTSRGLSWIATHDKYFFKIPRLSGNLKSDMADPRALQMAVEEYNNLVYLNNLDDALVKPVAILEDFSCLVIERIEGWDLFQELKSPMDPEAIQVALEEGIAFCARLHRFNPNGSEDLPEYDYSRDRFLPAGEEINKVLESHAFSVVTRGYEIRNFMRNQETNRLIFFDPHILCFGMPEEDFTRYILSILMANWGRHMNFFIWKKFDLQRLIDVYEEIRGVPLNKELLSYTFDLNIAMRKYYAGKGIKKLSAILKFPGLGYKTLYFYQIKNWRQNNGI